MKQVDQFSVQPGQGFEEFTDGKIYRATQGEDYEKKRVFLSNLTRFAKKNGFELERVVGDGYVEFKLYALPAVTTEPKKEEEPF